jgi:DDE family transposase
MPFYAPDSPAADFQTVLNSFVQAPNLPFQEMLTAAHIEQVAAEEGVTFGTAEGSIYTVAVTLWAFLAQVLSKEKACVAAVARILVLRLALGLPPCAEETGAYCKARAKLSEAFLQRLTLDVGQAVERAAPDSWLWKGRHVYVADGTTVSMPDTPSNQQAYPQPRTQKPGLGFPLARVVVLLALATAVLTGAAIGPYIGKKQGEPALLRRLLEQLHAGDVLLGDRYYASYWLVALAQVRGIDVVFRQHQRRGYDFRRGRRLGVDDHVVVWNKPKRPAWLDEQTYAALPATLTVREVRTRVSQPGYRIKELVAVTTLVDAAAYRKDDITDLYHDRWHVELDLRSIKTHLHMDILRCKKAPMVRKEIWTHFLAYNLTRKVMAQAALDQGVSPRGISFMGTVQTLNEFRPLLLGAHPDVYPTLAARLFRAVVGHRVGDRPKRCEPRAVKRRPKPLRYLTKPRAQARAELLR